MDTKKLLFITAIIFTLGISAGCKTDYKNVSPNQDNQNINTQITKPDVATQNFSAADRAAYEGAQTLKDLEFCNKISDENYKNDCKNAINDQKLLAEALTKIDTSICAKLSTKDRQETCKIRVEVLLKERENLKKEKMTRETTGKLQSQIIKMGDYTQCKTLKIEGYVSECEVTILSQKAISSKDISWCKKTGTESNRKQCEDIANKILGGK